MTSEGDAMVSKQIQPYWYLQQLVDAEVRRWGMRAARALSPGGQCSGLAASATSTTTSALGGTREIEGVPPGGVGRAQHR